MCKSNCGCSNENRSPLWNEYRNENGKENGEFRAWSFIFKFVLLGVFLILLWSPNCYNGLNIGTMPVKFSFLIITSVLILLYLFFVKTYFNKYKNCEEKQAKRWLSGLFILIPYVIIFVFSYFVENNSQTDDVLKNGDLVMLISECSATIIVVITVAFTNNSKTLLNEQNKVYSIDAYCYMLIGLVFAIVFYMENNFVCLCATLCFTLLFSYLILHYYFAALLNKKKPVKKRKQKVVKKRN